MLSSVSWGQFGAVIGVLLMVYYLFVGATYFQKEIKGLLSGKLQKKDKNNNQRQPENAVRENQADSSFIELEDTIRDLRYAVLERAGRQVSKQDLLNRLREKLANYSGLQKPAYRVAINNYIILNAKDICGVVFSEYELDSAWDALPR